MNKYFNISKKKLPIYIVMVIIYVFGISVNILLSVLIHKNIFVYSNGIITNYIQEAITIIQIIIISAFLLSIVKIKALKVVITVLCISTLLFCYFWVAGRRSIDKKYFEFKSQDNTRVIIVEECSWLLGGESNVYQKTNTFFIRKLEGDISTDDGYRPFTNNDFSIEWQDNAVYIEYGFGSGSIRKTGIFNYCDPQR